MLFRAKHAILVSSTLRLMKKPSRGVRTGSVHEVCAVWAGDWNRSKDNIRMKSLRTFATAAVASACMFVAACSGDGNAGAPSSSPATADTTGGPELSGKVVVFAAASLNKAFTELGDELKKDNPGLDITFSFEGSSTLVDQMSEGAPADVFASADEKNMTRASESKLVGEPKEFATNVLTLIVPAGNPAKVTGLDASLDNARLVVCAKGVPCGNATEKLAADLGVTLKPVSEEQKVTDVRGKVEAGEADAGLVYTTDAKAAGDKVEIIPVEGADKVVNHYPIALTTAGESNPAAKAFMDLVLSAHGQEVLASYGFGAGADVTK